MICKCYSFGHCNGTRERDDCHCKGDESQCDFYDYVRERAHNKKKEFDLNAIRNNLYRCAHSILRDECPMDVSYYLCTQCDAYDDMICTRCWENYLQKVVNGEA